MSSLKLERECRVAPQVAVQLAVASLERQGYARSAASASEAQLLYQAGSPLAGQLDRHRHRLTVNADGAMMTFLFEAGLTHGGLVVDSERAELERRVDAVMAQVVRTAPLAGRPRAARCPVCATVAADGAKTCAMCGIEL